MCKAMENLMKDVILQREEEARREARQKAIQETRHETQKEERRNFAVSLIKMGKLTMEEIAVATGLTAEMLSSIESSLKKQIKIYTK